MINQILTLLGYDEIDIFNTHLNSRCYHIFSSYNLSNFNYKVSIDDEYINQLITIIYNE